MAPLQKTRQQLQTREEIINCIKQLFIESQRPLLISNFINASQNNGAEYESDNKYFVVADNWPEVDS
jgi:hypothetical protein